MTFTCYVCSTTSSCCRCTGWDRSWGVWSQESATELSSGPGSPTRKLAPTTSKSFSQLPSSSRFKVTTNWCILQFINCGFSRHSSLAYHFPPKIMLRPAVFTFEDGVVHFLWFLTTSIFASPSPSPSPSSLPSRLELWIAVFCLNHLARSVLPSFLWSRCKVLMGYYTVILWALKQIYYKYFSGVLLFPFCCLKFCWSEITIIS